MAIYYQKLTETELSTFIDMRIQQLREEGATEDIDLKPALFDYYRPFGRWNICFVARLRWCNDYRNKWNVFC